MASAGYSGTPLAQKLGVKPGMNAVMLDAPDGFEIPDLPDGAVLGTHLTGHKELILAFFDSREQLERRLTPLQAAIAPAGALWIAWPKKASRVPTDITEDVIREVCLPMGLVDVKVCAIDETWSGLKLVTRQELR